MDLDWNALGEVAAVSIGVTVAVVTVFALGVLALARTPAPAEEPPPDEPDAPTPTLGTLQATLCFTACAAAVAYGIYLIVPQLH